MVDFTTQQTQIMEQKRSSVEYLRELRQKVKDTCLTIDKLNIEEQALSNLNRNAPISQEQQIPPTKKRRKYGHISDDVRALIVDKVLYGKMNWEEAMRTFDVSRASISRICNEEKKKVIEKITPTPPKKRGRKATLTIDMHLYLLDLIERNSQLTLKDLVHEVESKYQIETSTSAVDRALSNMEITWKNVLSIPVEWNTEEIIMKRMDYIHELETHQNRFKVYVDETGWNLSLHKERAISGSLTLVPKGKRVTTIGALGTNGFIHTKLVHSLGEKKRGTNADDFRTFILDLCPKIPQNSIIIMDNCKIHHAETLSELWRMIKTTYNIDVIFLPPYSPFLNPIEYAWNDLKIQVKEETFRDYSELCKVVEEKIRLLSSEKAANFFDYANKWIPQVERGLPFKGKLLQPECLEIDTIQSETWNPPNLQPPLALPAPT